MFVVWTSVKPRLVGDNKNNASGLQRVLPAEAQHRKRRDECPCLHLNNNTRTSANAQSVPTLVHINGQVFGERLRGAQQERHGSHDGANQQMGNSI